MATLYRKYRPQNFKEVVGQNHIKLTLTHELETDKLAHSYLFCGPRAVGKTTLARVLAKSLNCENRKEGESEPCNECDSCTAITAGRAMDIIEIDAASNTGVDNVRENIIANARVAPSKLKNKIFIIDEVHMLSGAAFNALLKIMEEPPENVYFVLATTEVHKIPATVISRCQRFDFKKISVSDIVKKLEYISKQEKIKFEKGVLESVARHSGGHMRDAESLLGQIVALAATDQGGRPKEVTIKEAELVIPRNDLAEVFRLIEFLGKKDAAKAIALVNKLLDNGFDLKIFCKDIIEILRQMIIVKINPDLIASLGVDLGETLEAKLSEINKLFSTNDLLILVDKFIKAKEELKTVFIPQLPLEIAIVDWTANNYQASRKQSPANPSGAVSPKSETPVTQNNQTKAAGPVQARSGSQQGSPAVSSRSGDSLSLEQVLDRWNEFLSRVKKINHSLSFVLKVCQPTGLEGNKLCLTFKHKLHQDRINEAKIKPLVEEVLAEVYGQSLIITANLDENLQIQNGSKASLDNNADMLNNNQETAKNTTNPEENQNNSDGGDEAINNILKNFGGKVV